MTNTEQDQPTLFPDTDLEKPQSRSVSVFLFKVPSSSDPAPEKNEPLALLISISNQLPKIIIHFGVYYVQDLVIANHYYESSVYATNLSDTIP